MTEKYPPITRESMLRRRAEEEEAARRARPRDHEWSFVEWTTRPGGRIFAWTDNYGDAYQAHMRPCDGCQTPVVTVREIRRVRPGAEGGNWPKLCGECSRKRGEEDNRNAARRMRQLRQARGYTRKPGRPVGSRTAPELRKWAEPCLAPGCPDYAHARDLCRKHYDQARYAQRRDR